jgi:small subunit ribosomal protein S16
MAVKIKLARFGKIRNPQYRIAVADARNRRDGRAIEVIGRYHPKEDPSVIEIDSERAQYWLGVGAQPTEPVLQLLKITGDWQKFKGLPGAEGTLKVKEPKPSKLDLFNAALAAADGAPSGEATQAKKKKAPAKKAAAKAEDTAAVSTEVQAEAAPAKAAPAEAAPEVQAEAAPAKAAPAEAAPEVQAEAAPAKAAPAKDESKAAADGADAAPAEAAAESPES